MLTGPQGAIASAMIDQLGKLIGGIRLVWAVIGVVTAVVALATAQTVAILNAIGVAGFAAAMGGGAVWAVSGGSPEFTRVRNAAIGMTLGFLLGFFLMFIGRPLDENEKQFGPLTFIGIVVLIAYGTLLSAGLSFIKRKAEPATKVCPECANKVLAAAAKCQYCQYRFDGAAAS